MPSKNSKGRQERIFKSFFLVTTLIFCFLWMKQLLFSAARQLRSNKKWSDTRFCWFHDVITNISKLTGGRRCCLLDMEVFWTLNSKSDSWVSQSWQILNIINNRSFLHLFFRLLLSDCRTNCRYTENLVQKAIPFMRGQWFQG